MPNDDPLGQIIWATIIRSGDTYASISHLIGNEFDTQAAMLCRPLFEDVVVAHWLSYNRDDSDWLVDRFFRHRDALALVQLDLERRYGWPLGGSLVLPGATQGTTERVAARVSRRRTQLVGPREERRRNRWRRNAQQLHHTAIGLPFQPHPNGPVTFASESAAAAASFRVLFTAYWMFGQQIFLLYEHFGGDPTDFEHMFLEGLREQASTIGFDGQFHPYVRDQR